MAYGMPAQATTDEPTAIRWRKAGGDVRELYEHPQTITPRALELIQEAFHSPRSTLLARAGWREKLLFELGIEA
jgi:hypothetical protein